MAGDTDNNFLKIFNNNLVGMILTGEDHIITHINNHLLQLADLNREDVIGKTGTELGIISAAFVESIWEELTSNEKLLNRELSFTTKSGKLVYCLFSIEKIMLEGLGYWLTTLIDISARKKTEKELADVYNRVTDGFVAIDSNWNYSYINKNAALMMDRDPIQMIGKNVWAEFPHLVGSEIEKAYRRSMEKQEVVSLEMYFPPQDIWYLHMIYPSADACSVFFKDISFRKKSEKRIEESERRFRILTKTAPVGIFQTDANGATTFVNDIWLQYSGMQFEEAMGDGWLDAVHPEDREWLSKGWQSKTEKKVESFSEYRIIDKQGRLRWVDGKAVPVLKKDGSISGYIGIILDITERKIAEQRISESEESKRFILNAALDAVVIIDAESNISFWNPQAEKIFGWTATEVIGRSLTETIIPAEYAALHKKGMLHYLKTGEGPIMNRLIEITAVNKAGLVFPVELSIIPVNQEKGISFCAFVRDISIRKKTELSLKERTEQLRELSTHLQNVREDERMNIAREIHDELGQQLTGLKMDIAWLMKKANRADEGIKTKFADTLKLVDTTVKTIRRISTELRPSIIDDLGLNAALEWLLSEFKDRLSIELKYENSFDDMHIDPNIAIGLFRILQESLNNIAKHANAKTITVTIKKISGFVHLIVQDDGIGFDTEAKKSDLTFGLLGIRERAYMMKGDLEVFSKPGQGTKIDVSIPFD